jgi:hypothetical protein
MEYTNPVLYFASIRKPWLLFGIMYLLNFYEIIPVLHHTSPNIIELCRTGWPYPGKLTLFYIQIPLRFEINLGRVV